MSDPDTRSVAEIIGWEPTDDGYWILPGESYANRVDGWVKPKPDDMLAWLRNEGWTWSAHPHVFEGVRVNVNQTGRAPRALFRSGPTLHAALEAAVRAVAGEEA